MLELILAGLVTTLVVYLLAKEYKPQPVLLLGGILLLTLTAVFDLGTILPAEKTTHLKYFDIFKIFSDILSLRLAGLGLTLMAIAGFARYMEHVGASKALFSIFEKPLKSVRSPYMLLVISFLVTQILVIFIPSHAGLGMLLMVTMYPILIRAGVSPLSALAVIGCCQFIDHGPGSGNVIMAAKTANLDPATYFIKYQLPVTLPIIFVVAITHFFIQKWWDKREGFVFNPAHIDKIDHQDNDCPPRYYAILPIIPLILIIGFSPLMQKVIKLDVTTAMIISTTIALFFEYIRLRSAKAVLDSFMLFFEGMGKQFVVVVSLIVSGELFANGLLKIGAVDQLITTAQSAGLGIGTMIVVMSFILALAAFLMGSGNAAFFSFAALTPRIAAFLKIDVVTLILPMQIMTSFGRTVSPITAAIVAISGIAGVSPFQVVKRTAIPMAAAAITNLGLTFVYL
ncbi:MULTISPECIES: C4-dicarboxylate transporter DcuC [Edwardsiella]|uniref:Anaerobic C4-dicarboxylate transporter DcuC n=2 Tax=Edwardsiella anguillarum TaxID=1821960 RepID=A0A076LU99_9GAMM|nr:MULTISPECIES: C4-dicarboxylate transporter DcuC [Edwardsiella]AIJ10028.1 Anaerobic C4-dicarboxylate transporter DcuC [Edwardsiella anguillarum ET080813]AKR77658.1 C4-dicarboxylate transporter DcuC [Edwardsiella sp. LADL05-105]KAB0589764.1 C4-dicarboxylate ABC transporter [Edwardsiella anguillarum]UOU80740.1 C4-dicarboxylate transporter DcuC [Edwardsiella anguillarum]WHP81793.1 C4-dicarboxylate transporter DcuC [Edwardsiella anguillarum]